MATVTVVRRQSGQYQGKQGGNFFHGVSAESVGSTGLCLHMLDIPPHTSGAAHVHAGHESAIYVISGTHEIHYGDALQFRQTIGEGDIVYIPPDVPHMPVTGEQPVRVIVARTDPREQESVHLLESMDRTPQAQQH